MNKLESSIINIAIMNSKMLGNDFIESYIPFISTLISKKQYIKFTIQEICDDFEKEYGFKMPSMPMTEILSRMKKTKILKGNMKGEIIPDYERIVETDFDEISKDNLMKYKNIKKKYIQYAKEQYGFNITEERAEENISAFIKENYIETLINETYVKEFDSRIEKNNLNEELFILYKFIIYLFDEDYDLFKILKNFCLGYTIAGTLNLDNTSGCKKNFTNKKLFFDTQFILRLLGLEGAFYKSSYESIIEILNANGCKMFVFRHTLDEIKEILENAKDRITHSIELDKSVYIPQVQRFFMEHNYTEGDIKLLIATLENKLKVFKIYLSNIGYEKVTEKYQIDEQQLYDEIKTIYSLKNQFFDEESKKETIYRDVKSMSLIYREMQDNRALSIETSQIFFVTTNKALACACKNFDKKKWKKDGIVPCVTDIFLGTLLWFQDPIRYDKLKENQIMANCYAATRPTAVMINKFIKEVEKLKSNNQISEEDYNLMKNYEIINSLLSDKVVGNIENINEDTTYEILNSIKESFIQEFKDELKVKELKVKELEKEKNEIENKNRETVKILKNDAHRTARYKALKHIVCMGILPIFLVIMDFFFNVFDIINSENVNMLYFRILVYGLAIIPSVLEAIKQAKDFSQIEAKEYEKICLKYKI